LSWEFAFDSAVALLGGVVEYVISWAWSASVIDAVEDVGGVALNTIVENFNKAFLATRLNLIGIPRRIWA
jgi:hypothetical protein